MVGCSGACCVNTGYTVVALVVTGVTVGKLNVADTGSGGWSGVRMDEGGDKLSAIFTALMLVLVGVA